MGIAVACMISMYLEDDLRLINYLQEPLSGLCYTGLTEVVMIRIVNRILTNLFPEHRTVTYI